MYPSLILRKVYCLWERTTFLSLHLLLYEMKNGTHGLNRNQEEEGERVVRGSRRARQTMRLKRVVKKNLAQKKPSHRNEGTPDYKKQETLQCNPIQSHFFLLLSARFINSRTTIILSHASLVIIIQSAIQSILIILFFHEV